MSDLELAIPEEHNAHHVKLFTGIEKKNKLVSDKGHAKVRSHDLDARGTMRTHRMDSYCKTPKFSNERSVCKQDDIADFVIGNNTWKWKNLKEFVSKYAKDDSMKMLQTLQQKKSINSEKVYLPVEIFFSESDEEQEISEKD